MNDKAYGTEMITHYGMGKSFGLRYCTFSETGIRECGNQTYDAIDAEIERILEVCHKSAKKTLTQHKEKLDKLATRLIEVESLNSNEIDRLLGIEDGYKSRQ